MERKRGRIRRVKYWKIISDNLDESGWKWGSISTTDYQGRQFWVVAAEREGAGRFIVCAVEKLTAFLELESAIRTAETMPEPRFARVRVSGNNGKLAYLFSATASPMILAATGQPTVNPKKGPKSCIAASPVTYRFGRFV